jgi:hypothetical protein
MYRALQAADLKGETVGLLDSDVEEPKSKLRRYIVSGVVFAILVVLGFWYLLRFYPEKHAAEKFFDALVAGDTQHAYDLWHGKAAGSSPSYTYKDFLDDWGPNGYYGPVKSYQIESATNPRNGGSGVIVVVDVSPLQPFPTGSDSVQNRSTKVVRIWVERKDKALSFPP